MTKNFMSGSSNRVQSPTIMTRVDRLTMPEFIGSVELVSSGSFKCGRRAPSLVRQRQDP